MRKVLTPILVVASVTYCTSVFGQCPQIPLLGTGDTGWPLNSSVVIIIVDPTGNDLATSESAILNAANQWETGTKSGQYYSTQVVTSAPASLSSGTILVQRGSTTACGTGKSGCTTILSKNSAGQTLTAQINIASSMPLDGLPYLMTHEDGHTYGFGECVGCSNTAMNPDVTDSSPTAPTACDDDATYTLTNGRYGVYTGSCYAASSPCGGSDVAVCVDSEWQCDPGSCNGSTSPPDDCPNGVVCTPGAGWKCNSSPIIIDAFGNGFHLTDDKSGVRFRVLPAGLTYQMSWPDVEARNGWLVLDRNGNGKVDDFSELFGDVTPQPTSKNPNGYLALAVFDQPENGGNGNGVIDPEDSVYDELRVWIDENHNGISESNELHSLQEVGLFRIDLHYEESRYVDQNGNQFRYKGKVWDEAGNSHNLCYDVFVVFDPKTGLQ